MTASDNGLVLVTGATGGQGGQVALASLARGMRVRALVRNPAGDAARALAAAGAEIAVGDFGDPASLSRAMFGVRGVFSMQQDGAPASEFDALIDAAVAAGVDQYVHSTVSGVREQEAIVDPRADDPRRAYWEGKLYQERRVRSAPFRYKTYLRPSLIIDNIVLRAEFLYPRLASDGDLLIAMDADTPVAFVSYETIGRAAAEALGDPARFAGQEIELADAYTSYREVAAALTAVTGKRVTVTSVDPEIATDLGLPPRVAQSHHFLASVGYPARPEMLARYGIPPLPLADWLRRHADQLRIGDAAARDAG